MPKTLLKYPLVVGLLFLIITVHALMFLTSTSPDQGLALWSAYFVSALGGGVLTALAAVELSEKFEA